MHNMHVAFSQKRIATNRLQYFAADDDAEYGYHSASSSSELERHRRDVAPPLRDGASGGIGGGILGASAAAAASPAGGAVGFRPTQQLYSTRQHLDQIAAEISQPVYSGAEGTSYQGSTGTSFGFPEWRNILS